MRVLYFDIDTLRPDHLGCYGYHRDTSPNIDRLASEGVRFENCYVSDSPCLPSRAALHSGKCGIRNGAINHGGAAADPWLDPRERMFRTLTDNFIIQLRHAGLYPVTVSPFGERHASFWFYNGFREMFNTGKGGGERSDEIVPIALDWLDRKGKDDDWYLHINVWDPHTPYQVPDDFGNPFENDPPPAWMTEEVRRKAWDNYGPGCAREPGGDYLASGSYGGFPRMVNELDSMAAYRTWIDGYDTGIRYADMWLGKILDKLEELEIMDDTLIFVSSDHGENQGELSVFGDHQTGDHITNRVPLIVWHPKGLGGRGRVDRGLLYQFDWAATLIDLCGGEVPDSWDGESFLEAFGEEEACGRDSLVVANCAWVCQRSARWDDYLLIRSYHSGFKNYPEIMLFNVTEDPHEQNNMADARPELVGRGLAIIEEWVADEMRRSSRDVDAMQTVLREGGPHHASFLSDGYTRYHQRLIDTGREAFAEALARRKRQWQVRGRPS